LDDGIVRAGADTTAALDAQALIDMAAAVAEADGLFGADFLAGMSKAALAHGGDLDDLFRALVAGELDDVDQRRLIVLVRDHAMFQIVRSGNTLVQRTQRKSHGKTDTLGDNGSLQEDAAAQLADLAGNDLVG